MEIYGSMQTNGCIEIMHIYIWIPMEIYVFSELMNMEIYASMEINGSMEKSIDYYGYLCVYRN